MQTPIFSMTPDFTPIFRLMQLQTRLAMETSRGMMKLAMMPWAGLPAGVGSICTPMGSVTVAASVETAEAPVAEPDAPAVVETTAVEVEAKAAAEPLAAPAIEPEAATPVAETAAKDVPAVAPAVAEPAAEATADAPAGTKPAAHSVPQGEADDLTALNGVGPKLAEALNAEGIYHFAQIAAWTDANVAWMDENLPGVRGRASRNGWVAQAADLAQ